MTCWRSQAAEMNVLPDSPPPLARVPRAPRTHHRLDGEERLRRTARGTGVSAQIHIAGVPTTRAPMMGRSRHQELVSAQPSPTSPGDDQRTASRNPRTAVLPRHAYRSYNSRLATTSLRIPWGVASKVVMPSEQPLAQLSLIAARPVSDRTFGMYLACLAGVSDAREADRAAAFSVLVRERTPMTSLHPGMGGRFAGIGHLVAVGHARSYSGGCGRSSPHMHERRDRPRHFADESVVA
jgi:hypothetical protein